uniref:Uncharacterized protein n=1 Tax=Tetraselmis sp. GSL018 TaxID=582737 RepID=A0A061RU18_9CHLO
MAHLAGSYSAELRRRGCLFHIAGASTGWGLGEQREVSHQSRLHPDRAAVPHCAEWISCSGRL